VNNFGVLGGYRGVNVDLLAEQDSADLEIKGWYIAPWSGSESTTTSSATRTTA